VIEGIAEASPHDRALSRALAAWLDTDLRVHGFRARNLAGGMLAWAEVEEWMRARGPAEGTLPTWYARMPIDPAALSRARYAAARGEQGTITLTYTYAEVMARTPRQVTISYVIPSDAVVRLQAVMEGTALDDLLTLVHFLVDAVPWTEPQASVYVLTGLTPLISPLRIEAKVFLRLATQPRLRLEVDPRVTQRELATAYQAARQSLVSETRHRDLSEKHVELAVWSLRPEGYQGTWAARLARWNAAYPDWAYRQVRNFATEVKLARRRFLPDLLVHQLEYTGEEQPGDDGGDNGDREG
jgi:hypothetical protein